MEDRKGNFYLNNQLISFMRNGKDVILQKTVNFNDSLVKVCETENLLNGFYAYTVYFFIGQ